MTEAPARPRFAAWCGWVIACVFALTPLAAWAGPLAFAPLLGLAGLLCLPNFRVRDQDRPAAIAILVMVIWAAGSTVWSPYHPKSLDEFTGAKLVAEAVLFGSAISAARNVSAASGRWILRLLAWGMALLGFVLIVEAATGAGIYRALRQAMGDPIRPDLAIKNVAQGLFVLSLFAPVAVVAAARSAPGRLLAVPILGGVVWPSIVFGYDAPLVALGASVAAMALVMLWPRGGPRALAVAAASFFLAAPLVVWGARRLGWYDRLAADVSLSWSQRMSYWRHAQDWIGDHPLRGWGLDASRMFGPGIRLHPHDAALQIWLELGLIGAVSAAVLWVAILAGQGRSRRDPAAAAACGCALAYLTFNAVSFGVWQEWWLALGALACCACAVLHRRPAAHRR
ncbi:MAG TPA: O-antigen ligase family protein [Phenylobacterium sp.]|nr:O-antigen ligase family protein [Phenylobacterium sp.]